MQPLGYYRNKLLDINSMEFCVAAQKDGTYTLVDNILVSINRKT